MVRDVLSFWTVPLPTKQIFMLVTKYSFPNLLWDCLHSHDSHNYLIVPYNVLFSSKNEVLWSNLLFYHTFLWTTNQNMNACQIKYALHKKLSFFMPSCFTFHTICFMYVCLVSPYEASFLCYILHHE